MSRSFSSSAAPVVVVNGGQMLAHWEEELDANKGALNRLLHIGGERLAPAVD
jgi:hypothetical protein